MNEYNLCPKCGGCTDQVYPRTYGPCRCKEQPDPGSKQVRNGKRLIPHSLASVKVSGDLQLTEYGKDLLNQCIQAGMPDAIHAEYVDGNGVKYAGTLYRVAQKEQGSEQ